MKPLTWLSFHRTTSTRKVSKSGDEETYEMVLLLKEWFERLLCYKL